MEHHFVQRVSRLFPSSFASCQFRSVPDVVESSISITKTSQVPYDSKGSGSEPFSYLQKNPFLSSPQEPKLPKNEKKVWKSFKKTLGSDTEGRRCTPVTPISVLASEPRVKPKESNKINNGTSSSNSGWFSSDEEGEVDGESDALFSLSSCSSESFRLKTANTSRRFDNKSTELGRCSSGISAKSANTILNQCSLETTKTASTKNPPRRNRNHSRNHTDQFLTESKIFKGCEVADTSAELFYDNPRTFNSRKTAKTCRKTGKNRRSRNGRPNAGGDCGPGIVNDRLEESYAVEKSSNDPHGDFRTSMVEMIIEKQIFGAKDLERLLYCFLSLNSPYYHRIIFEVFTEICDALFSN